MGGEAVEHKENFIKLQLKIHSHKSFFFERGYFLLQSQHL